MLSIHNHECLPDAPESWWGLYKPLCGLSLQPQHEEWSVIGIQQTYKSQIPKIAAVVGDPIFQLHMIIGFVSLRSLSLRLLCLKWMSWPSDM